MQNHVRNKMTASKTLCEKQQLALFHLNIAKNTGIKSDLNPAKEGDFFHNLR